MARVCAPVLARPEARRVPVRAQVTLALAPALELKLAHVRPSREPPRVPPLLLRELPRELRAPQAPPHRLPPPRPPVPLCESQVLAHVLVLALPLEPSSPQRELPLPLALPPREPSLAQRTPPPPPRCRQRGRR